MLESNANDENYGPLQENYGRLQAARDSSGQKLSVIGLPSPVPLYFQGDRLPASYANFYIANNVVLVPIFGDSHDAQAIGTLKDVFPGREVIGLRCNEVVAGLGAIHCITQQEPKAVKTTADRGPVTPE